MNLTDMVIMPGADYQAACDAIREKTEGVGYIRSGDMAELIRGIETGTKLPELTNPATAAYIAEGYQAIDADGNVLTGTVYTYESGETSKGLADSVSWSQNKVSLNFLFEEDYMFKAGATERLQSSGANFGDATAEDVAAGKTFTSTAGIKVTGTGAIKSTKKIQLPINNYSSNPVLVVSESNPNGLVIAAGAVATITEVVDGVYAVFYDSNTQGADWQNRGGDCRILYVRGSLTPFYPSIAQTFTQMRLFKMLEFDEYDAAYIEFYDN